MTPRRDRASSRLEGRPQLRAGFTLTLGAEAMEQNRVLSENPPHLGTPEAIRDGERVFGLREGIPVHDRPPPFRACFDNAMACPKVQLDRGTSSDVALAPCVAARPHRLEQRCFGRTRRRIHRRRYPQP